MRMGRFVAQRRPCVLEGKIEGAEFGKWNTGYLRDKAGDQEVDVEWRENARARYGM
jgi:hypothetical protein